MPGNSLKGNPAGASYAEDGKVSYAYDAAGKLAEIETQGETKAAFVYTYDSTGNILAERRSEDGQSIETFYEYDALGRIVSWKTSDGHFETYTYDAVGNLTDKESDRGHVSMEYDAANRLICMSAGEEEIRYTYDADGNLLQKTYGDGKKDTYTYNGEGLLVKKETHSAGETRAVTYLYDEAREYAQMLTEECDKGTASYTYGRERIAAYQEGTRLKYFYDVRGSVAGTIRQENISEEAETQAESGGQDVLAGYLGKSSYRYTPFGELVCAEDENVGERFLYNAEAYDAVSGSYYLRARFYEPAAMRFNQPDIVRGDVREPQSLNRYAYVQNNPVMYEDPSGEILVLVGLGIGLAVGGAYAGYKYQNNRNRQQGISGASAGTGAKTPKSTAGYTGMAKQNKSQSNNQGSSSYQSTSNQNASKNNGYTTNTGTKSVSGTQQKTGTVQKDSETKSSSKACSATGNTGVKQPSKVRNKAVKTGVALEAPVVVELLPQAWPWIVTGGKAFISALAGMGIVKFVGEMFESKGDENEGRVEPEGEAVKESRAKDKSKGKEKEKRKTEDAGKAPNETLPDQEQKVGENGVELRGSKTIKRNGPRERVDIENPNPGKGDGNIHYHDQSNQKWDYDLNTK